MQSAKYELVERDELQHHFSGVRTERVGTVAAFKIILLVLVKVQTFIVRLFQFFWNFCVLNGVTEIWFLISNQIVSTSDLILTIWIHKACSPRRCFLRHQRTADKPATMHSWTDLVSRFCPIRFSAQTQFFVLWCSLGDQHCRRLFYRTQKSVNRMLCKFIWWVERLFNSLSLTSLCSRCEFEEILSEQVHWVKRAKSNDHHY